jgi:hypothetical protein
MSFNDVFEFESSSTTPHEFAMDDHPVNIVVSSQRRNPVSPSTSCTPLTTPISVPVAIAAPRKNPIDRLGLATVDSYAAEDILRECVENEQSAGISREFDALSLTSSTLTPPPKKNRFAQFFETFKWWDRDHTRIVYGFSRY